MKSFRLAVLAITLMLGAAFIPAFTASNSLVHSPGITVEVSRSGEIINVILGNKKIEWQVTGRTSLAGCRVMGPVESEKEAGGVRFKKELACDVSVGRKEVRLVEDFFPTKDSVRWEMELDGQGSPWSTAIETRLHIPDAGTKKFWTAWGDPRPDEAWVKSADWKAVRTASWKKATTGAGSGWADPLTFTSFLDRKFWYGAPYYQYDKPWVAYIPIYRDVFCIPLATVVEEKDDMGLSIVLSPEDVLQDMTMETSAEGDVTFSRLFRRISEGKPVHFSLDLTVHEADWRGGLRWMSTRYADYFNPPLASADELGGTAAYSSYEGDLDVAKFKRMDFTVNWRASFDFPYQGLFLPPVPDNQEWERGYTTGEDPPVKLDPTTSIPIMEAYSRRMRGMGFYVFNYFNVAEFGKDIVYPPPPPKRSPSDPDLWKDPNDYLYAKFADALLFPPEKESGDPDHVSGEPIIPRPWRNVVLDCGVPVRQEDLLAQARRFIQKIPDSAGLCIDRMDWIRLYNFRKDDGVSWYDGPVRSLVVSWNDMLNKLGPLEHGAGQVIFVNNHVKRIDVLRQADGFFDEFGSFGTSKNTTALLGIYKPVISWVQNDKLRPDPDTFMQRFLYLGMFPMAPFPQSDHAILPSASADQVYQDYGPLLEAMRGRKWVLLPHVINVDGQGAKANLFRVPNGYILPVTFGGSAASATVTITGIPEILDGKGIHCELIHPGDTQWTACEFHKASKTITIKVPLHRGCAMVRFTL